MKRIHTLGFVAAAVLAAAGLFAVRPVRAVPAAGTFSLEAKDGRYTLQARDAKVADVLKAFAEQGGIKIDVDEKLAATVTADLADATPEQVLALLARSRAVVYEADADGAARLAQARVTSEEEVAVVPAAAELSVRKHSDVLGRGVLTNTKRPVGELRGRTAAAILLQNAVIDTAAAKAGDALQVPEGFAAPADAACQLVQFDHAITAADRAALEAAGAVISHYVPNNTLAVTVDAGALAKVEALDGVALVEPYHPYFKMSRDVLDVLTQEEPSATAVERVSAGVFNVMGFRGADVAADLSSAGYAVTRTETVGGRQVVTVQADQSQLQGLLAGSSVQWVEPSVARQAMNDLSAVRTRVSALKQLHPTLDGSGVIVGITDSGIDYQHLAFSQNPTLATSTGTNTRIAGYFYKEGGSTSDGLPGDNDGHGTHVAGSVLGNGALSATVVKAPGSGTGPYRTNQFSGMAPGARVVMIEDFNSYSDGEQAQTAYNTGARISNNSWGNTLFEYSTLSATWDELVRDAVSNTAGQQELVAFFAAGNSGGGDDDGTGGTAGTVGEPGNAKNVISIGSIEQPRGAENLPAYGTEDETDSDWQVSSFSSRGPVTATDVRLKPDLVAPGSYVLSAQSHETYPDDLLDPFLPNRDYRYGNLDSGSNYAFFSGTSMATPVGAGAAALFYQYFTNAYGSAPSPAMVKAALVAGARMVHSLKYRYAYDSALTEIVDQGFGLIDVVRSVEGPRIRSTDSLTLLDQSQTTPLGTAETYQRQIVVNAGEGGLKIVLAWSDAAGTPGNAYQLVNNLDLVVKAPGGGGYLGNQFDLDGVHSRKLEDPDPALGDEYNNVEVITIRDAPVGTYTIQVYGYNVSDGPQDYALAIMKGIGIEGRTEGTDASVALASNDLPVVAYADYDDNGQKQIFVKQWEGPYGDISDLGAWRRIEDQWYGIRNSARLTGISQSIEDSDDPSVAVASNRIFVAWEQSPQAGDTVTPKRVYLRAYNGSDWVELANSAHDSGVSRNSSYDAIDPVVQVFSNGWPVVAWRQKTLTGVTVRVSWYDGTNWNGFSGSHTSSVPACQYAQDMDMIVDSYGRVVVSWEELILSSPPKIRSYRWSGAAWNSLGDTGNAPYAGTPRLAAGVNGSFYLAFVQLPDGTGSNYYHQVFVQRYDGSFANLGFSGTYGISSATNSSLRPYDLSIGARASTEFTNVVVAWQSGSNTYNSVLVKSYAGSTWSNLAGAGVAPGLALAGGVSKRPDLVVDAKGLPVVTYVNDGSSSNEVLAYTLVSDRSPPSFLGLLNAVGGTNGNVTLSWLAASDDISTNIRYRIYRGSQTFACGATPSCNATSVFANPIAITTNATSYEVTGLTPDVLYCFGVRALDDSGLIEANTETRSAGPVSGSGDNDGDCLVNALEVLALTEPCAGDTDADGMGDGWEWSFSTNNVAHTNALAMNPLDNGVDQVRTLAAGDGVAAQGPLSDLDGDGASNYEEYQWWYTYTRSNGALACEAGSPTNRLSPNPTLVDTDGDGMGDGWEMLNGLNPVNAADVGSDLDGDGLTNLQEYQAGSDPRNPDSDGDGLSDGAEVTTHGTSPILGDTDRDGLDDGVELSFGSSPVVADSNANGVADGTEVQLGLSPTGAVGGFTVLLTENFETASRTNWTPRLPNLAFPFQAWHLSSAEPRENTNGVSYLETRTPSNAYRAAFDATPYTNPAATYAGKGQLLCALDSPAFNTVGRTNLFVTWKEFFATEPGNDTMVVQVRDGAASWVTLSGPASGLSGETNSFSTNGVADWVLRRAEISQFAGRSNVQVRFLFTANAVNNSFPGWWVDDVMVYEAASVLRGWVRDNNGAPILGATVRAIGQGGVTSVVYNHRFVLPGTVLGEAQTAQDGSFEIRGLPAGSMLVKASSDEHIDEFWNGDLFTAPYGFGRGLNPGVSSRDLATNGLLTLSAGAVATNVHFELTSGQGRTLVGVTLPSGSGATHPVYFNGRARYVWNGSTNAPGGTNYVATDAFSRPLMHPDWITNAVAPTFCSAMAPGYHTVYAGTTLSFYPEGQLALFEGEPLFVALATNQARSRLFVTAEDGAAYAIRLDGRAITNGTPALIDVLAGYHQVLLVRTNGEFVAPKTALAGIGERVNLTFTSNDLFSASGYLAVNTVDVFGNVLTGAQIYVDGQLVASNRVLSGNGHTPATVTGLAPGEHRVSVILLGYDESEQRLIETFSGVTNVTSYVLYQGDNDYDLVGDGTEIAAYTDILLYDRDDDTDGDGLKNLFEFELYRLFGLQMNAAVWDSDSDGVGDGAEVGYDGNTNLLALTTLATNTPQFASSVRAVFVGDYLAGVDNFGTGTVWVSAAGDRFQGTIYHPDPAVPTAEPAVTVFTNILSFPSNVAVNAAQQGDTSLYADLMPDHVDTDADGLWDGFESAYGLTTLAALDPINAGQLDDDADEDDLSNYREFLGMDQLANTNDWTNPGSGDTDGDLMPDGWEYQYGLNPRSSSDAFADADGDGLVSLGEYFVDTNPHLADTDADFLSDYNEVAVYLTDPQDADTDDDTLLDGQEVWDLDMDGIQDGGAFPMWAGGDLDGDGNIDGPTDWDTDGDGMPDGFEVLDNDGNVRAVMLDPFNPTDGNEDADGDGLSNLQEYLVRDALYGNSPTSFDGYESAWKGYVQVGWSFNTDPYAVATPVWDYSTDPFNADTDGDGMPDGFEVIGGLHPADPVDVDYDSSLVRYDALSVNGDPDADGLWNSLEYAIRFSLDGSVSTNGIVGNSTHPWRADSDNDGLADGEEYRQLFSNPTASDTDNDRLADGVDVSGRWGEVSSAPRSDYQLVPCPGCVWTTAQAVAASWPHPNDPAVLGHLAVISSAAEQERVEALLTGTTTNVALGMVDANFNAIFEYSVTGEPLVYQHFATNEPQITSSVSNNIYMRGDGYWGANQVTGTMTHFVVEWPINVRTNHYDEATNDLWELVWPAVDYVSRPYWVKVPVDPTSPFPEGRWGAGMVYVPGFERKSRQLLFSEDTDRYHYNAIPVLDNRKLVLLAGVDGVDRYTDIWEFSIRSNTWKRSVESFLTPANYSVRRQGYHSGVSEFGAVLTMGYWNTKAANCACKEVPWDCNGEGFGEPKNRPWNYGWSDSSYDMTYILGGWNDQHEYLLPEPMATTVYKSTDDPHPVVEFNPEEDDTDGWSSIGSVVQTVISNAIVTVVSNGTSITGYGQIGEFNEQVPIGNYTNLAVEGTTNEAGIVTITENFQTNRAAGVSFATFPIVPSCETVTYAALRLDLSQLPALGTGTVFTIHAEFDSIIRDARSYDGAEELSDQDNQPWYRLSHTFLSSPLDVVITNVDTGVTDIDVTVLVQEVVLDGNWSGNGIGFLITKTNGPADYAFFRVDKSRLRVDYVPSYINPPAWVMGSRVQTENGEIPSKRKSFGLAYDSVENKLVLFGGMNGNTIFGDTYTATLNSETGDGNFEELFPGDAGKNSLLRFVRWTKMTPEGATPEARWGHAMVYDESAGTVVLFGGFNVNNEPLADLWEYSIAANTWTEITDFIDNERPSPRGGAMMAYYGGEFYKRGAGDAYKSTHRDRIVLFGGTDGKNYYNDTWVFDRAFTDYSLPATGKRWYVADPGGEQSLGPSPRAFGAMAYGQNGGVRPDVGLPPYLTALGTYGITDEGRHVAASSSIFLFGGRTGTWPNSPDTDRDMVDDGQEHELGGTAAGRDPRYNALVNSNAVESVPFTIKQMAASVGALPYKARRFWADLEVVSYQERGEVWRSELFTWQGWPHQTLYTNEYYVIGDETRVPFETPATDRVVYVTGVDALSPDWTNLWWHKHGIGDPQDARDVWQLGRPDAASTASNGAPPYARSGRWVYGTNLKGVYPANARMELFTPIFDLTLPNVSSTDGANTNSFFLVFHEWLDMADSNDTVQVDLIRPATPADIATRVSGLERPLIPLIDPRNNHYNTDGQWRRVIVPLDVAGNDSNLYVRFTLNSDSNTLVAGGWYLDDIAILQGSEISGVMTGAANVEVCLLGENFNDYYQQCTQTDTNGNFSFGLLPLGNYQVTAMNITNGPFALSSADLPISLAPAPSFAPPEFSAMTKTSPVSITWPSVSGIVYRLDFGTNLLGTSWTPLAVLTGDALGTLSFTDTNSMPHMIYRVAATNAP